MTTREVQKEYFDWMCALVRRRGISYRKLMKKLHETEFYYTIPLDGNREEDGVDLRYRFAQEEGYRDFVVANCLDNYPCSVLEMMIALAIRCEETIMSDPDVGNRTGKWFWEMVESLGLSDMTDRNFDLDYVDRVVKRFLDRKYKRNGEGGLFTLKHCRQDLRQVEIWYQMCWYLNESE